MSFRLNLTLESNVLLIAVIALVSVYEVTAQEIKGRPFVTNYTVNEYSAGLQNWQVGQDDEGIMYFANNSGLLSYDGVRWRTIETPQRDNIRSFDIADDGRIYIGSSVTFGYFERDSLGYFRYHPLIHEEGVVPEELTEVWTTYHTEEYTYFQSRSRLYRLKERSDGSWDVKTWDPEGNNLFMYAFFNDGEYYVHQRGVGLLKLAGDELQLIEGSEVLANDRMQVMLRLKSSEGGAPRYLMSQFQEGMYIYDGKEFKRIETADAREMSAEAVYKGTVMPDGRIVFATLTGGIYVLDEDGKILERYDESASLLSNSAYSAYVDRRGSLWLGLSDGISRMEIASPTTQFTADDGITATPFAARIYRGDLYIGTGNYLLKYNHSTGRLDQIEGVPAAQVFSVEVVDDCLIFTGRGLFQICGDNLEVIKSSVAGDFQCRFVIQGVADTTLLYIGTIEGMAVFRRSNPGPGKPRWTYLGKVLETINAEVRTIYPQADGSVWIDGFTSGLFHMRSLDGSAATPDKPYEIDVYNEDDGLVDGGGNLIELFGENYFVGLDTCYTFIEDEKRFQPIPDFDPVHSPTGGSVFSKRYSDDTTIISLLGSITFVTKDEDGQFNFSRGSFAAFQDQGAPDLYVDEDGLIWFTTNDAVIKYDPSKDNDIVQEFNAVITEVRQENARISIAQLFDDEARIPVLDPDHEAIRFEFAAPYFSSEDRTQYQFWLENFARDWSEWGDEKYKEYTNLPPGEYVFHVRAQNVYGSVSDEATYEFRVEAPWYATWWAYLLYVVAGLAFIGFVVGIRTRQLKQRSEELEETVAERTLEITKQAERQEALFELSSKIAAAETEDEICNAVVEGLQSKAFDYPFVGVLVRDKSSGDLLLKASHGWDNAAGTFKLKSGQGLCSAVFDSGEVQNTPDVTKDERHVEINGRGSEIDVPIKVGDDVVGVLVLEHGNKNAFDKHDIDILTTAASQAGVALGQAYSHSQVEQRLRELGTVDEISQLITAKLNQKQLFELIGEQMREIFSAQIVYIAMYDERSGMIQFPWTYGEELTPMKYGEGLTSKVIRDNKPLLINEAMSERHEEMGIAPKGHISASYLGVPIPADEKVIGVISVQSTEVEGRFDENDMRLLQTIATHVGIAIQNAALFEELQSAKLVAEEANEAKSAFLSTVSHELRTPLTSVLGFAKIIRKRLIDKLFPLIDDSDAKVAKTKKQVVDNLDVVVSEGERLTGLINDVLDLAKIEAGKIEWHMADVQPADLVERATASTSSLFEESPLKLNIDIDDNLPVIWGDENKLLQVLINLLSNAVKFTDDGSVTIRARQEGDQVVMGVTDTGAGITLEDQGKIFDKFKQVGDTLTDKPKGTGLGLPISKEIIEHHGGRLWVESEEGTGSTFSFSLPVKDTEEAEKGPIDLGKLVAHLKTQVGSRAILNDTNTSNILVVDDEANIRSLLMQELTEAGFNVRQASNGKEALDKIRDDKPDLIILDVMMPEMNGFDLAAVLKNDPETMEVPIIILSVLRDEERGYRLGVDRYLTKPIEIEALLNEIDHLIEQGKSRKKVMVVDEDQSTIQTLGEVLQSQGYHVVEADGTELLKNVLDSKPDIILLNSVLSRNHDIIKSIRFEKGMENVLFLIYQ